MQPPPTPIPAPAPAVDPTTAVEVWTAFGTWFGGIATAAAVAVALWISHRDWSRADADRREREVEGRDQEKAQARLIVSQLLPDATNRVSVLNESTAAVFNVFPEYSVTGREDGLDAAVDAMLQVPHDVIPAHGRWTVPVMYLGDDGSVVTTLDYYWSQADRVTITFADSAGLRWRRTNNSEPERMT
jgi:hypothetical protein